MAKQGKQKVACTETKVMMNTIDKELSKIVELDALKLELSMFLKGMVLDERRRALGVNLGPRKLPHLAFLGDPGMGKSMVARILAKLLHMIGIIPKDKVTEVDLHVLVPDIWLKIAAGGILLLNDCAAKVCLYDYSKAVEDIEKAIICMDSGQVVVIMAGRMEYVLSKCVELSNRVSNIFFFEYYYSGEQLAKILQLKVCNNIPFHGYKLHSSCTIDALSDQINEVICSPSSRENGHIVDELLVKAKENLDSRIDVEYTDDDDSWVTFTIEDFIAAAATIS